MKLSGKHRNPEKDKMKVCGNIYVISRSSSQVEANYSTLDFFQLLKFIIAKTADTVYFSKVNTVYVKKRIQKEKNFFGQRGKFSDVDKTNYLMLCNSAKQQQNHF